MIFDFRRLSFLLYLFCLLIYTAGYGVVHSYYTIDIFGMLFVVLYLKIVLILWGGGPRLYFNNLCGQDRVVIQLFSY